MAAQAFCRLVPPFFLGLCFELAWHCGPWALRAPALSPGFLSASSLHTHVDGTRNGGVSRHGLTRCTSVSHEAKLASPPYTMRLNWPGSLLAAGGEARVHRWGRLARLRCFCGAARRVAALGPPAQPPAYYHSYLRCRAPPPHLALPARERAFGP